MQPGKLNPFGDGFPRLVGQFELYRPMGLLLQNGGSTGYLVTVSDVRKLQFNQITGPELAIDGQVKQRQISRAISHLQADSYRPDFSELQRCLLPVILHLFQGVGDFGL